MKRVGFIHDYHPGERPGGAQYQVNDLMGGAPGGFAPVWCLPGQWDRTCDAYIVVTPDRAFTDDMEWLMNDCSVPRIRLVQQYDNWMKKTLINPVMERMDGVIFRSPAHQEVYLEMYRPDLQCPVVNIPNPVNKDEIRMTVQGIEVTAGYLWAGEWRASKGQDFVKRWAKDNKVHVDMFGTSVPQDQVGRWEFWAIHGQLPTREDVWRQMAAHEHFVHMPRYADPFATTIVEAWAAGADLITAGRIGCTSYGYDPDELLEVCGRAPADFWGFIAEVAHA